MENASKALLMVAAVLIGVMILSLGVYLFTVFGDTSSTIEKRLEQAQIDEFNSQFTKFEGLEKCTIHDIASIINLAKDNNKNYVYENDDLIRVNSDWKTTNQIKNDSAPFYIYVGLSGVAGDSGLKQEITTEELNNLIKKYSTTNNSGSIEPVYFKCLSVTVNEITKKVQGIIFTKTN